MGLLWLHGITPCCILQGCHYNSLYSHEKILNPHREKNLCSKVGLTTKAPSVWAVWCCHCWFVLCQCHRDVVTCVYICAALWSLRRYEWDMEKGKRQKNFLKARASTGACLFTLNWLKRNFWESLCIISVRKRFSAETEKGFRTLNQKNNKHEKMQTVF